MRNTISQRRRGFTLMELIITVILIGVIAGLALNNYFRVMQQGYERDAFFQLKTIQATLEYKKRKNGTYPTANMNSLAAINAGLDLQMPANSYYTGHQYIYLGGAPPGTYALRITTSAGWAIGYNQATDTYSCVAGSCPTCTGGGCPGMLL